MIRIQASIFNLLIAALLSAVAFPAVPVPAFAAKGETLDQLIARAESARAPDRPALYIEIARQKAEAVDELYMAGNTEAAKAGLRDVVDYSRKAADASIDTGKRLKNNEIALRKMAEKFHDIKRTVAFDDQPPIEQTIDELEKMRTDLLAAMFGKKRSK